MTMPPLVAAVRATAAGTFGPDLVGHDLSHLDRVYRLSMRLAAVEGGDTSVLGMAAYLHDYHRVLEQREGGWAEPEAARSLIADALAVAGAPAGQVEHVLACVACTGKHAFSVTPHASSAPIEGRVLHDADSLDALGAIGTARAFMFGGALGEPLWDPTVAVRDRYESGATASVVHHFHEKLLRLADDMLTEAGRELAVERRAFMLAFLQQLMAEWAEGELDFGDAVAPRARPWT